MLRIIDLINHKNHFLEKFYSLNESELLNFVKGNFDNLEKFYATREKILENIRYIDNQIDINKVDDTAINLENRKSLREALAIKDEYVNRILAQDLEVLQCIEYTKSAIIRELQEVQHNKKAVSSYKLKTFGSKLSEKA